MNTPMPPMYETTDDAVDVRRLYTSMVRTEADLGHTPGNVSSSLAVEQMEKKKRRVGK